MPKTAAGATSAAQTLERVSRLALRKIRVDTGSARESLKD
jgi:hypothetical protein